MMTANFPLQALQCDMVGVSMRNEYPQVAPWGGKELFFFTNPISIAVPTKEEPPIVIDMAAGSFSAGQVIMAARDKRLLPSPHLFSIDGVYTDDPKDIVVDPADRNSAFRGGIVTLGYKGLAWALIVEIFSGLLAGTKTSNENWPKPSREHPWNAAQFHMAINVGEIRPIEDFKADADRLIRSLRSVEPAQGFERVIVPGEVEASNEERRKREGVPIRPEDWQGVVEVANRLRVDLPA